MARQEVLDGWLQTVTDLDVDLTQPKTRKKTRKEKNVKNKSNFIPTIGGGRLHDPVGDELDIRLFTDKHD